MAKPAPEPQKAVEKAKIPLDSESHKLYYVNYKIRLNPRLAVDQPCCFP